MYKYGFRFSIYIWYFLKGMVAGFFLLQICTEVDNLKANGIMGLKWHFDSLLVSGNFS